MGRPRLPRTRECETCHWYHCATCRDRLALMPYTERVLIAAHHMQHRRLDRRRETYLRYRENRKRRAAA